MSLDTVLLRDEFSDNRAAGSVNGTLATDGVNVRTVTDTALGISINSDYLQVVGHSAWDDPWHYYILNAAPGVVVAGRVKASNTSIINRFGVTGHADNTLRYAVRFGGGVLNYNDNTDLIPISSAYTANQEYKISLALRNVGAQIFIDGKLVHITSKALATVLRFGVMGFSGTTTANEIRVAGYYLATPLASDGFGSTFGTTDGLGHAEGIAGGIGSGGGSVAWTQQAGTWANSGGKAAASALSGGIAIATAAPTTADQFVSVDIVRSAGDVGLVLRYTDANNYIRAIHNGTNVQLIKKVAGSDTTVVNAAATYSSGARLVVSSIGTAFRVYYNNALVGSGTISDSALQSGVSGIYTSNTGNTLDNFTAYASGTGGEYDSALQIVLSNERTTSMAMSDSLLKVPVKILADALALTDSMLRTVIKSEMVQMALSSAAAKVAVKALDEVVSLAGSVARAIITSDTVQMALDSAATKIVIRSFGDGIEIARSQAINYGKKIIRIIRLLGSLGAN